MGLSEYYGLSGSPVNIAGTGPVSGSPFQVSWGGSVCFSRV